MGFNSINLLCSMGWVGERIVFGPVHVGVSIGGGIGIVFCLHSLS